MAISSYAELQTALQNWPGQRTDTFWTSRVTEFITLGETRIAQSLRIRAMEEQVDLVIKAAKSGGTVGGTANAITLTPSPAVSSNVLGDTYSFTATATNTTAATVTVGSAAAANIRKFDGTTALEGNDVVINVTYYIYYDGTQFRIIPPGGVPLPSRFVAAKRLYLDTSPKTELEFIASTNFWAKYTGSLTGQPRTYTIENEYAVVGPAADSTYYGKLLYFRKFAALSATSTNWLLTNAPGAYLYSGLIEAYALLGNSGEVMKYSAMFDDVIDRLHKADKRDRFQRGSLRAQPDFAGP